MDTISRRESLDLHFQIVECLETAGRNLLKLKESGGWKHIPDSEGKAYKSWTDYLSRAHGQCRNHLYELMRAAPVNEYLRENGFQVLGTGAADILTDYPQEHWLAIVQTATARYGKATESQIKSVAHQIFLLSTSGGVNLNGEATPIDAALTEEDAEALKRQQEYINGRKNRVVLIRHTSAELVPTTGGEWRLMLTGRLSDFEADFQGGPVEVSVWLNGKGKHDDEDD